MVIENAKEEIEKILFIVMPLFLCFSFPFRFSKQKGWERSGGCMASTLQSWPWIQTSENPVLGNLRASYWLYMHNMVYRMLKNYIKATVFEDFKRTNSQPTHSISLPPSASRHANTMTPFSARLPERGVPSSDPRNSSSPPCCDVSRKAGLEISARWMHQEVLSPNLPNAL